MPYGLYISAAGADAQSQRLQVLTNNLANVDTPGFKRELSVLQARHAEAIEQGDVQAGSGGIDDVGGGVDLAETVTDFSRGSLKQTGIPTDIAIDGDGFFVVDHDGEARLTRAGNFHFSASGRLLSDQGRPVLSSDGNPVDISPTLPWQLLADGRIKQGGNAIPLALVKPQSLGDLAKAGGNLFSALGDVLPVPPQERKVVGGFLEQSTVQPAVEMMQLIETSRAYEANVRLIQNHDHMIGSLVNRVLRQ